MSTRDPVIRTEEHLATEYQRLGFGGYYHEPSSICRDLLLEGYDVTPVRSFEFNNWGVTVYRHPNPDFVEVRLPFVHNYIDDEEPNTLYSAEWQIESRSDTYEAVTYLFLTEPTPRTVDAVFHLHELSRKFEIGTLSHEFICSQCEKRIHWLDIPTVVSDPTEVTIRFRGGLVKNEECGCHLCPDEITPHMRTPETTVSTSPSD